MCPTHEAAEVKATDAMEVDAPHQPRGSALLFEQKISALLNMNLNEDMIAIPTRSR